MDWTVSRSDRFEFIEVLPDGTEGDKLDGITGGRITENMETVLKVSGSLTYAGPERGWLDRILRVYMISQTDDETHREARGTFITTTPKQKVSSTNNEYVIDMYSLLLVLRDRRLENSLLVPAGEPIIAFVAALVEDCGLKTVVTPGDAVLSNDIVYLRGDTYLSAVNDLLTLANYNSIEVDEMGRAILAPYKAPSQKAPSWTFVDNEQGVFLPDVDLEQDTFDTPNVVVVTASTPDGELVGIARNDDPPSPYSTVSRGREITRYEEINQTISQEELDAYAARLMITSMMSVESVYLTHSFVPITRGDVVVFNYVAAQILRRLTVVSKDMELSSGAITKTRLRWFR